MASIWKTIVFYVRTGESHLSRSAGCNFMETQHHRSGTREMDRATELLRIDMDQASRNRPEH